MEDDLKDDGKDAYGIWLLIRTKDWGDSKPQPRSGCEPR